MMFDSSHLVNHRQWIEEREINQVIKVNHHIVEMHAYTIKMEKQLCN